MILLHIAHYFYFLHYLYRRLFHFDRTFVFNSKIYKYFLHPYNTTWRNERSVEIPVVMEMMKGQDTKKILEVGNVLLHYINSQHTVVDKYENSNKKVVTQDIVYYESPNKYDLIICISTLEHVGFDESPREEGKHRRAVETMRSLLSPSGKMVVTVPWGYNPDLDSDFLSGRLGFDKVGILKRVGNEEWIEAGWDDIQDVKYGSPYRAANALLVAIMDGNS